METPVNTGRTAPSEVLFRSKFVTVDTVPAVTPEGVSYAHTRVTPRTRYGGIIVPFRKAHGTLSLGMVRQARPVLGKETLEFPRGSTQDLGSSEAMRELSEELGLPHSPEGPSRLGTLHPDTGLLTTEVGVWAVRLSDEEAEGTRGHIEEFSGVRPEWHTLPVVMGMVSSGTIVCGMTLAALALLRSRETNLGAAGGRR